MHKEAEKHLHELIKRFPAFSSLEEDVLEAYKILVHSFESNGKLLIAGNGGSCADAEHIAGELMKGFVKNRELDKDFVSKLEKVDGELGKEIGCKVQKGLPAIVLSNHQSLNTAFINDVEDGGTFVYAQQVNVYGQKNDVFLAISTSGNSKNVLSAAITAKAKGLKVISLTGETGGKLASISDVTIKAPCKETHLIQEMHLPIYHCLCLMIEEYFF